MEEPSSATTTKLSLCPPNHWLWVRENDSNKWPTSSDELMVHLMDRFSHFHWQLKHLHPQWKGEWNDEVRDAFCGMENGRARVSFRSYLIELGAFEVRGTQVQVGLLCFRGLLTLGLYLRIGTTTSKVGCSSSDFDFHWEIGKPLLIIIDSLASKWAKLHPPLFDLALFSAFSLKLPLCLCLKGLLAKSLFSLVARGV